MIPNKNDNKYAPAGAQQIVSVLSSAMSNHRLDVVQQFMGEVNDLRRSTSLSLEDALNEVYARWRAV